MGLALYATFRNREMAERIVGTLLDAGVIPEDISLVTALRGADRLVVEYEPALQMVDAGRANVGEMRLGPASHESEGSDVYESNIGGGISTIEPDDSVSGPEEMDESESVAEDLSQPAKGSSFGSEEFRDADSFAQFGSINSLRRRASTRVGSGVEPIDEISAIAEPGILILGDGHLALEVLRLTVNGHESSSSEVVEQALAGVGLPQDVARSLASVIDGDGAVLSVVETIGTVPIELIETVVESSKGENLCTFPIPE